MATGTGSVGTLNIRINVSGVKDATKEIEGLNNLSLGGLLQSFNKVRWALMSIQMAFDIISWPIKTMFSVMETSFKALYVVMDTLMIKPLIMIGDTAMNTLKIMGVFAAGTAGAMVAFGVSATSTFAKFNSDITKAISLFDELNAVSKTGGTGAGSAWAAMFEDMNKQLTETAVTVGTKWGVLPTEIAGGFKFASAAGLSLAESQQIMGQSAEFARAGEMSLDDAISFGISTLGQFNLVNQDGTLQLDKLAGVLNDVSKTAADSMISIEDITATMKNVGPLAEILGIDMKDILAATATLGQAGLKSAEAGTVIKTMIGRLQQNSGASKDALDAMGLSINDVNLKEHTLGQVLETVMVALNGVSDSAERNEVIIDLLGLRGVKAARLYGEDGVRLFDKYRQSLNDTGGSLDYMANVQMKSFQAQSEVLNATLEGLQLIAGKNFAEGLVKGITAFASRSGELGIIVDNLSKGWGDWLGEQLPKLITWVVDEFVRMEPIISDTFTGIRKVIIDAASGIGAVWGTVSDWIIKNWDRIKSVATGVWSTVVNVVSTSWDKIKTFLFGSEITGEGLFGDILIWWDTNGTAFLSKIQTTFDLAGQIVFKVIEAWKGIFEGFGMSASDMVDKINVALSSFIGWLGRVEEGKTGFERLKEVFISVGAVAGSIFNKIMELFDALFGPQKEGEVSNMSTLLDKFSDVLGSISTFIDGMDAEKVTKAFVDISKTLMDLAESSIIDFFDRLVVLFSDPEFLENLKRLVGAFADLAVALVNVGGAMVKYWDYLKFLFTPTAGAAIGEGILSLFGFDLQKWKDELKETKEATTTGTMEVGTTTNAIGDISSGVNELKYSKELIDGITPSQVVEYSQASKSLTNEAYQKFYGTEKQSDIQVLINALTSGGGLKVNVQNTVSTKSDNGSNKLRSSGVGT